MENAMQVTHLAPAQWVRLRPWLHVPAGVNVRNFLVSEALCLALAEAHCGTCSHIKITLSGNTALIEDNGLGLPLEPYVRGVPFAQRLFTDLHGCRDHKAHREVAHHLCKSGMYVVCALADSLTVHTFTEGVEYCQTFLEGIPQGEFQAVGPTTRSGTSLAMVIDNLISDSTPFDPQSLEASIRNLPLDLTRTNLEIAMGS